MPFIALNKFYHADIYLCQTNIVGGFLIKFEYMYKSVELDIQMLTASLNKDLFCLS